MIDLTKYELKPIYKNNVLDHYGLVPKAEPAICVIQGLDEIFNDDYFDVKVAKQAIQELIDKKVKEALSDGKKQGEGSPSRAG